jgi:hypothetical protein
MRAFNELPMAASSAPVLEPDDETFLPHMGFEDKLLLAYSAWHIQHRLGLQVRIGFHKQTMHTAQARAPGTNRLP